MRTDLSHEALSTLRNCDLLRGCGTYEGVDFVRCIPRAGNGAELDEKAKQELSLRVAKEVNEDGVCMSWHETHGYYVKVEKRTKTYRFICYMKS